MNKIPNKTKILNNNTMIKKIILTVCFSMYVCITILAQQNNYIKFSYDAAGNRTKRELKTIVIPSLKSAKDTSQFVEAEVKEDLPKVEEKFDFDKLAEGKVKVFPNPTEGDLMVRLENISDPSEITIQLYNSSGGIIKTQKSNSTYFEFDMKSCPSGIYLLNIASKNEKLEYKIIKK